MYHINIEISNLRNKPPQKFPRLYPNLLKVKYTKQLQCRPRTDYQVPLCGVFGESLMDFVCTHGKHKGWCIMSIVRGNQEVDARKSHQEWKTKPHPFNFQAESMRRGDPFYSTSFRIASTITITFIQKSLVLGLTCMLIKTFKLIVHFAAVISNILLDELF